MAQGLRTAIRAIAQLANALSRAATKVTRPVSRPTVVSAYRAIQTTEGARGVMPLRLPSSAVVNKSTGQVLVPLLTSTVRGTGPGLKNVPVIVKNLVKRDYPRVNMIRKSIKNLPDAARYVARYKPWTAQGRAELAKQHRILNPRPGTPIRGALISTSMVNGSPHTQVYVHPPKLTSMSANYGKLKTLPGRSIPNRIATKLIGRPILKYRPWTDPRPFMKAPVVRAPYVRPVWDTSKYAQRYFINQRKSMSFKHGVIPKGPIVLQQTPRVNSINIYPINQRKSFSFRHNQLSSVGKVPTQGNFSYAKAVKISGSKTRKPVSVRQRKPTVYRQQLTEEQVARINLNMSSAPKPLYQSVSRFTSSSSSSSGRHTPINRAPDRFSSSSSSGARTPPRVYTPPRVVVKIPKATHPQARRILGRSASLNDRLDRQRDKIKFRRPIVEERVYGYSGHPTRPTWANVRASNPFRPSGVYASPFREGLVSGIGRFGGRAADTYNRYGKRFGTVVGGLATTASLGLAGYGAARSLTNQPEPVYIVQPPPPKPVVQKRKPVSRKKRRTKGSLYVNMYNRN